MFMEVFTWVCALGLCLSVTMTEWRLPATPRSKQPGSTTMVSAEASGRCCQGKRRVSIRTMKVTDDFFMAHCCPAHLLAAISLLSRSLALSACLALSGAGPVSPCLLFEYLSPTCAFYDIIITTLLCLTQYIMQYTSYRCSFTFVQILANLDKGCFFL